jgi:RNA polymerase sigma-70 factor (ECF subfamily)
MNEEIITPLNIASVDDQQLINLIGLNRDKQALAELYDRYRHSLGGFLRRKLYQEKLVDEVYNDVMMTVWQKANSFRGDSKISTWIFGIAYRTCLSHSRKETKHTLGSVSYTLDELPVETEPEVAGHLRAAITELSHDHRTAIELSYFYGHSILEISEMTDCPVNTVKTRLFHARQKLKNIMLREQNLLS